MAFTMLRQVPSMPIFWRVLIINGCWVLSKALCASIEIIIWFLSFSLLIWCITLIDLHMLKNPCIPGINPAWLWCPLNCMESLGLQGDPVHPKGNQYWIFMEGLMLKLKLQYCGHLMQRTDSFEKTLVLQRIEGGKRKGWQRMRWLDGIIDSMDMSLCKL